MTIMLASQLTRLTCTRVGVGITPKLSLTLSSRQLATRAERVRERLGTRPTSLKEKLMAPVGPNGKFSYWLGTLATQAQQIQVVFDGTAMLYQFFG